MREWKRPPGLRPGMTLGIVAPSGPVRNRAAAERGVEALERLGFRVRLGQHVYAARGYLAGQDHNRAEDLLAMLEQPDVDGIICLAGGYGAIRTAMAIDLDRLRGLARGPAKAFVGFSDVTVIHALLQRELGWITFYGPMVRSFDRLTEYSLAAFRRALIEPGSFNVEPAPAHPPMVTLVGGRAEGSLVGGCLALVVSLIGTPWELDLRDTVFFFEDIHEQPYRIDRMLSQLLAGGRLRNCAGIVVGEHVDCDPDQPEHSLQLEEVLDDLIRPLGLPAIYGLPIGHGAHLATLPLGARVELDADARRLRVVEGGIQ
jgi:muramoyltetrapeptide carboxypeptidase